MIRPGIFCVARISYEEIEKSDFQWIISDAAPFMEIDELDVPKKEIEAVFELYSKAYSSPALGDGRLFIQTQNQLFSYKRWVLIINGGEISGFALYKIDHYGLKLGLTASDGSDDGRKALKQLHRKSFKVPGIFGEVSPPLQLVLEKYVPKVSAELAKEILRKPLQPDPDGIHYHREIRNIGSKKKKIMGMPTSQWSEGTDYSHK